MQEFLFGLALLAISGLSWFAYKEQEAFKQISKLLKNAMCVVAAGVMVYNLGVSRGAFAMSKASDAREVSFSKVVESAQVLPGFLILTIFGAYCYLLFLDYLPSLISSSKEDHVEDKNDD